MKTYFLSSTPCALKIDGELAGSTNGFERYVNLYVKDGHFIEFIPLNGRAPIYFFLTNELLFSPPKGVKLGHAPHVLIIYADEFQILSTTLNLETQKNNAVVYADGAGYAFYFHGKIYPLNGDFQRAQILTYPTFILVKNEYNACILSRDELIFNGSILSLTYHEAENILTLTHPANDFYGGAEKLTFDCKIYPQIIRKEYLPNTTYKLPNGMTTACFLQSLQHGKPLTKLLCKELKNTDFQAFFGEFFKVIPVGVEKAALVYKTETRNVFTLKFFRGEVQNGVIENIIRER